MFYGVDVEIMVGFRRIDWSVFVEVICGMYVYEEMFL